MEVEVCARAVAWVGLFPLFGNDSQKRKCGVEVDFALADIRHVPSQEEWEGFPEAISVDVVSAQVFQR